jgi:nicotinamide mononucleotide (NMN) deamidase PncC
MPSVSPDQLAREVHARGVRLVIAVTGGGSGAIPALLTGGGASRSILAAVVPYCEQALVEWLGARPEAFCSPWTARAMAMAAFSKAAGYEPDAPVLGVACTASLASDRPKRGPHRAHFAYQSASTTAELSLELEKGRRPRAEEEALVAALVLNHVAEGCGAAARVAVPLSDQEHIHATRVVAPQDQQELLAGRVEAVRLNAARDQPGPRAVFPGAFHPLHDGHKKMADVARQILGCEVAYEISILNVDKPPLDFIEIDERAGQFSPRQAVWLTRAPRFTQKAQLFPGATFVVGADTIERIAEPRYYQGQESALEDAIDEIASRGCNFLVFGRIADGAFRTLDDLKIPSTLERICRQVPRNVFREDISSTFLRSQGLAQ